MALKGLTLGVSEILAELSEQPAPERIHELAQHKNPVVLKEIIFNPYTTSGTLDMVARKDPYFEDKWLLIAQNKDTSAQTLEWIYKRSEAFRVGNPMLKMFHRLGYDEKAKIRAAIASNANTPQWILNILQEDILPEIRLALSENKALSWSERAEILEDLLKSNKNSTRMQVLDRAELSADLRAITFQALMIPEHSLWWPQVAMLKTLDYRTTKYLLGKGSDKTLRKLYANENLGFASYELMMQTEDVDLLVILAKNSGLPEVLRTTLANVSRNAVKEVERLMRYRDVLEVVEG